MIDFDIFINLIVMALIIYRSNKMVVFIRKEKNVSHNILGQQVRVIAVTSVLGTQYCLFCVKISSKSTWRQQFSKKSMENGGSIW